jgi:hypothetical protein
MADNAEHLEAIFLKENLNKTDVVDLLSGHRVIFAKGSGGSSVYNLVTGEKVDGSKAKDIIERWRSLKEIWESSTHGRNEIDLRFDPNADDLMISKNYALWWAWSKWKPTSTIWKGFSACLKHGLEQEWITPHDYVPQEETPEEVRETKAKLDQVLGQPRKGKGKASDYADKDGIPYKESENTVKNRLRLIGLMAEMLQDKKLAGKHLPFADQTAIGDYFENNYAGKYKGKGLKANTINKILAKANNVLKKDEEV